MTYTNLKVEDDLQFSEMEDDLDFFLKMEDDLNLFFKWKTTLIFQKWKNTSFFFENGRQPQQKIINSTNNGCGTAPGNLVLFFYQIETFSLFCSHLAALGRSSAAICIHFIAQY